MGLFISVQPGKRKEIKVIRLIIIFLLFIIDPSGWADEGTSSVKLNFTGTKISLNFQDIQVRAVLQLLADFTETNIVVSDKVNGNITLRLSNIPWDEALELILTTQGLTKRKLGNITLIDTFEEHKALEHEATQKLAKLQSFLIQINYAKAVDIAAMLRDKENALLSESGSVGVDVRSNMIWVQDTHSKVQKVKALVRKLDVPDKQVVIEARIVNMTKDSAEDLGVRWGISKSNNLSGTLNGASQLAKGTQSKEVPVADRLNLSLAATPLEATPASLGIALAKLGGGVLLDMELTALESQGRAEVVASPRLMTTNRQPALIESGEDIPYQETTSSGATSVSFKKAVLSLKVTPQITSDGKLLMDLQINQDSDSGRRVQGVPIVLTKAIETKVWVKNAETIVLGGIYQQNKNNTVTRIPFIGRIPVLKYMFSRKEEQMKNKELLIFITPRIMVDKFSIKKKNKKEK